MSNYVQTTFFTPKDTLPITNPAKTIFGAAYDVEFGNISTAIATKYDSSTTTVTFTTVNTTTLNVTGVTTTKGITDNAAQTAITISSAGAVTIAAPTSGTTLTVNGFAGTPLATFTSGSSATASINDVVINRAGSTANAVAEGPNIELSDTTNTTATTLQNSGGQFEIWNYNGGWNQRLKIDASGNVNVPNGNGSLSAVWSGIPINLQSGGTYTLQASDNGKAVWANRTGTSTFTLPTGLAVGTTITVVNQSTGTLTLATAGDLIYFYPTAATGSRTFGTCASGTLVKLGTSWMLIGTGIS